MSRILQPLLKTDNVFREISFEEAFHKVAGMAAGAAENATLVMTTGNYSNEELYLLQRVARAGLHTNAVASFDYYSRGTAFFTDKNDIVPLAELQASDLFVCAFDNAVQAAPQLLVQKIIAGCPNTPRYVFNTPDHLEIRDFAAFFRALNYYLIRHNLAKGVYVEVLGKNYDAYKKRLLEDDYKALLLKNSLAESDLADFIGRVRQAKTPVFLVWERFLSGRGAMELENLCMLLDIQAKPAAGFLCIKPEINSQGLFDMGIFPGVCPGGETFDAENVKLMEDLCGMPVCHKDIDIPKALREKAFTNCILLNSNNIQIPEEILQGIAGCRFKILQASDASQADGRFDLVLPASLPEETDGMYTDMTRVPHPARPLRDCPVEKDNFHQLEAMGEMLGLPALHTVQDVFMEYVSFFRSGCRSGKRHFFR